VLIISGCAEKKILTDTTLDVSTKFYAIKKADKRDLKVLERLLLGSPDKRKYAVLIGSYYYKIGEIEKSKKYLQKYYNEESSDPGIYVLNNYLLGAIYKDNNEERAKYINEADKYKSLSEYRYFLNYFCGKDAHTFKDCFKEDKKEANAIKAEIKEEVTDNKTMEIAVPTEDNGKQIATNALFVDKDSYQVINGLLYTIEQGKLDIKLVDDSNEAEYVINDKTKLKINDNITDFGIDYGPLLDMASIDDYILNSKYVFIVVNDRQINEGKYILDNLKLFGIKSALSNYESGRLKDMYDRVVVVPANNNATFYDYNENTILPDNVTFIGIGNNDAIKKMIPYIRYVAANPQDVKIVIATDYVGDEILDNDYYPYFRNVKIYTYLNSSKFGEGYDFMEGYKNYYGEYPDIYQYIAYDMIKYMNNDNEFLTSIKKISDGRVDREAKCFYINYRMLEGCK